MRHVPTRTSARAAAVLLLASAAGLLVAGPAAAADPSTDFTYTMSGSSATITGYTGGNTVVDIPATIIDGGTTYSVTTIGDNAFRGNLLTSPLTSVTIPGSVTTIGNSAFRGDLLTSVVIPDSVTTIETYAFYNNALTSVTIAGSVTTLGNNSFRGNDLAFVAIPASVTSIGNNTFAENALTSMIFAGAAPTTFTALGAAGSLGTGVGLTIYYYAGAAGFTSPWNGYSARAISAAESALALTPVGSVTADGATPFTATVTVRDDTHTPVVGVPVAFTVPVGVSASAAGCTTTLDGTCAITITSSIAATYTLTAMIGADPAVLSQNITFTAAPGTTSEPSLGATGLDATVPLALASSLLALGLALLTVTVFRRKKVLG